MSNHLDPEFIPAEERIAALLKPRSYRELSRLSGIPAALISSLVKSGDLPHVAGLNTRPKVTLQALLDWQRSCTRRGVA